VCDSGKHVFWEIIAATKNEKYINLQNTIKLVSEVGHGYFVSFTFKDL